MKINNNSKIVPIDQLNCWDKNPRAIHEKDFARLKRQIQELGQYKPLIVFSENNGYTVLGGNMRLRALKELGQKDIWISIVEPKTEAEKIKISLSDNDSAGFYQDQQLAELICPLGEEIKLEDFKVDLGGSIDLGTILDRFAPTDEDNFDAESEASKIKKPKSKRGEIYQPGKHKLVCGNATVREDVEKLMNGKKADMVFTDPPYNLGFNYENYEDKKSLNEYMDFCKKWFTIISGVQKIIITPGPRNLSIWENIEKPLDMGIWLKSNSRSGASVFHFRLCEPIIFYGKFNSKRTSDLFEYARSIDSVKTESEKSSNVKNIAPAKPINFICDLCKNYSQRNEKVLDLFGGSGTTLIACEKIGRVCRMMEIDPVYCDVIRNRYEKYTEDKNTKKA